MGKPKIKCWSENIPLEQTSVAEAWARDGFDGALWVDPPGQEWLNSVRSSGGRVLVKEGIIEFDIEGAGGRCLVLERKSSSPPGGATVFGMVPRPSPMIRLRYAGCGRG
jgi:hypothetical protein